MKAYYPQILNSMADDADAAHLHLKASVLREAAAEMLTMIEQLEKIYQAIDDQVSSTFNVPLKPGQLRVSDELLVVRERMWDVMYSFTRHVCARCKRLIGGKGRLSGTKSRLNDDDELDTKAPCIFVCSDCNPIRYEIIEKLKEDKDSETYLVKQVRRED